MNPASPVKPEAPGGALSRDLAKGKGKAMKKRWMPALITAVMLLISCGAAGEAPETILLGGTEVEIEEDTGPEAPEWADVSLNARGFLDEGEYVFEDDEEGHYMYVSPTIRIQIERTLEIPVVTVKGKEIQDKDHRFHCFTADIWCNLEAGEIPQSVDSDPENPGHAPRHIDEIAAENKVVFATSTDYYTYRSGGKAKEPSFYHVGIEIRRGEVRWEDPHPRPPEMPNYETLAFLDNGKAESFLSTDYTAEQYLADGATEVFTFGPCLVRDGELTEYLKHAHTSYNPRMALGVAEPGHYVAMLCEGRLPRSKGVQMTLLAQMMKDHGCQVAVNMVGGQTAVFAFMGKQLNQVSEDMPRGRKSVEVLAFGTSELVTSERVGHKVK